MTGINVVKEVFYKPFVENFQENWNNRKVKIISSGVSCLALCGGIAAASLLGGPVGLIVALSIAAFISLAVFLKAAFGVGVPPKQIFDPNKMWDPTKFVDPNHMDVKSLPPKEVLKSKIRNDFPVKETIQNMVGEMEKRDFDISHLPIDEKMEVELKRGHTLRTVADLVTPFLERNASNAEEIPLYLDLIKEYICEVCKETAKDKMLKRYDDEEPELFAEVLSRDVNEYLRRHGCYDGIFIRQVIKDYTVDASNPNLDLNAVIANFTKKLVLGKNIQIISPEDAARVLTDQAKEFYAQKLASNGPNVAFTLVKNFWIEGKKCNLLAKDEPINSICYMTLEDLAVGVASYVIQYKKNNRDAPPEAAEQLIRDAVKELKEQEKMTDAHETRFNNRVTELLQEAGFADNLEAFENISSSHG